MILYVWRWDADAGSYVRTRAIDTASSVIWITRFNDAGEFELYVRADRQLLLDIYTFYDECILTRNDSDTAMIIDRIHMVSNAETGDYMTITGRSAEAILARRVVPVLFTFYGTAENCIRKLITDNIIASPIDPTLRNISGFTLGASQGYTETIDAQYVGDDLLTIVQGICKDNRWGFRVRFNGSFVFELYKGTDRSVTQSVNPRVVFSPQMQNVSQQAWDYDRTDFKMMAYVGGEGEGIYRKTAVDGFYSYDLTGLSRREMYVDASSLSSKTEEGEDPIPDAEYYKILREAGKAALMGTLWKFQTEAEAIQSVGCTYGVDFFLGDTVTNSDSYGFTQSCVVVEVAEVEDESGFRVIPKLSSGGR